MTDGKPSRPHFVLKTRRSHPDPRPGTQTVPKFHLHSVRTRTERSRTECSPSVSASMCVLLETKVADLAQGFCPLCVFLELCHRAAAPSTGLVPELRRAAPRRLRQNLPAAAAVEVQDPAVGPQQDQVSGCAAGPSSLNPVSNFARLSVLDPRCGPSRNRTKKKPRES